MNTVSSAGINYFVKKSMEEDSELAKNSLKCKRIVQEILKNSVPYTEEEKKKITRSNQVIACDITKDCVKDVGNKGEGFVFNRKQLSCVLRVFPDAKVSYDGLHYWVTNK